jgi:hypothetical protein
LTGLLWGMALLSMLLLPSVYRAGADFPHDHSLLQLLIDASDGVIDHHHAGTRDVAVTATLDWFDPGVPDASAGFASGASEQLPDVGERQESAPATSGVHLMLSVLMLMPAIAGARRTLIEPSRRLTGRAPRVLLPPPRPAFAA